VSLSTHYYVLSLATGTSLLFEAFRDFLIELENRGFPIVGSQEGTGSLGDSELRKLAHTIDSSFGQHHALDPLKVVVVGERRMIDAFSSVTAHEHAVIGYVEGDPSRTSGRDLGQIVWPVVREAMSGVVDAAMRDLQAHAARGTITSGLDAVARQVTKGVRTTLLVEEDYRMKGSLAGIGESPIISPEVDVRNAIDDAIDAVIEKALEGGGHVVFTPSGSLRKQRRIVSFLMNGREPVHPGGER